MFSSIVLLGSIKNQFSKGFSFRATSNVKNLQLFRSSTNLNVGSDSSVPTEQEYASSYHSPVMYKECIDALLKRSHNSVEKKNKYKNESKINTDKNEHSTSIGDDDKSFQRSFRVFIDGTLGGGGHSQYLLESLSPGDVVIGTDVDPSALVTASTRLKDYLIEPRSFNGTANKSIFIPVRSNFRDIEENVRKLKHPISNEYLLEQNGDFVGVDGILLDLGISSHQIDNADRGFAFMKDGPLDMRMSAGDWKDHTNAEKDQEADFNFVENKGQVRIQTFTAADICNNYSEQELIKILKDYGDEPRANQIARSIIDKRPLATTGDLRDAVAKVTPEFAKKGRRMGRTATLARVFQSLRIVVNDEEAVLRDALEVMAPSVLRKGGRLVVLTYHSLEDRAVKRVMRDGGVETSSQGRVERDIFGNEIVIGKDGIVNRPFKMLDKKQKATDEEVSLNSRARSATLRVAERL